MMTAEDKSIYGQIKTKGEQLAELVKMAENIQNNNDKNAAEAYHRGLDDAWEAARKIIHMPEGELLNIFTECYSAVCTALQVILKYDASEAIEKLKAYEEKQKADDEIKVGDEVEPIYTYITGVVTLIDGDIIYILWRDGSSISAMKLKEVTKTGRHFDIASILEDMRND